MSYPVHVRHAVRARPSDWCGTLCVCARFSDLWRVAFTARPAEDGLVKGGHQTGKLCMKAGKETGSLLASGFQACKKTLGGGST